MHGRPAYLGSCHWQINCTYFISAYNRIQSVTFYMKGNKTNQLHQRGLPQTIPAELYLCWLLFSVFFRYLCDTLIPSAAWTKPQFPFDKLRQRKLYWCIKSPLTKNSPTSLSYGSSAPISQNRLSVLWREVLDSPLQTAAYSAFLKGSSSPYT